MRIGNLALVSYPGEMFVDYQLSMEDASPCDKTIALAYTNGCIGYVPTADAYPVGGYEVDQAFKYYGTLMIGPACEDIIKTTTIDMLNENRITRNRPSMIMFPCNIQHIGTIPRLNTKKMFDRQPICFYLPES